MARRETNAEAGRKAARVRPGLVHAVVGAAALGFVGALVASLLAGAGLAIALIAGGAIGALVLGGGGLIVAARGRAAAEKAADDLDFLARRLLRVESRLAEAERKQPRAAGPSETEEENRQILAEVTGEIALISGLLRDLAAMVASHDRSLATIEEERARAPEPRFEEPRFEEPRYESPRDEAPRYEQPRYEEPRYEEPVYRDPRYEAPPPQARPPEPPPRERTEPAPVPFRFMPIVEQPEPAPPPAPAPMPAPREDVDPARMRAIVEALRADRIEIHLQPIVSLPQRKTRFYEALARLRLDGETLIGHSEFMPAIERAGVAAELDGKVAARAAAIARHLLARGSDAFVTVNLAQDSLETPGFLRTLLRLVEAYPDVAGKLAFEVSQRSWRMLDAETAGALAALRARGIVFVMDRASDLRVDPMGLADRGVRYVKLPARLLIAEAESRASGLDIAVADLSATLGRAGIRLVADGVEREEDVPDLIDLDVPLGQGLVFGAPRAVRPDVVGGPPRDPPPNRGGGAEPPSSSRRTEATGEGAPGSGGRPGNGPTATTGTGAASRAEPRVPYRSVLRRAI